MSKTDWQLIKRPTGVPGLDELTHGGLPSGQATLILGEAGAGKTVLGLQILANAVSQGHGGVFVTFEESPTQLLRDAGSFSWGSVLVDSQAWSVIDARSTAAVETSGDFDIDALLAAIESRARSHENPWIIIDGIDQLLQHQTNPVVAVEQVRQINEYCEEHGWTLLLSGKLGDKDLSPSHLEGIEYMLPTALLLKASVVDRRFHRHMRVAKYRGTAHMADEVPMVMNDAGIQLPYQALPTNEAPPASRERVSSGVKRLDRVLGGGVYRGSSTLISGRPGTAKSTLSAGFARAAAERGEKALYVSFDEMEAAYVRNLASVGIDLQPHIDAGQIRFAALFAWSAIISEHVLAIQALIEEFNPQLLLLDPVSALTKAAGTEGPQAAVERILDLARRRGITTVMTSLIDDSDPEGESTLDNVSTIADTWIVLDYNVRAGERNRSLSIVKSRGTAHSNQQRELRLSSDGVDLADVYEYGSEVLMGTARAQKEAEEQETARRTAIEQARNRQDLIRRIEQARSEMDRLQDELASQNRETEEISQVDRRHMEAVKQRRAPGRDEDDPNKKDQEEGNHS